MATLIGKEKDFIDSLKNLISLDYDAVEAYEAAIERLDEKRFKDKLATFKADHNRHIRDLTALVRDAGGTAPSDTDMKHWITKGKTVLAGLIGDKTILKAMLSNEEDTNKAYERVSKREDKIRGSATVLKEAWQDEKNHYHWIESAIKEIEKE